MSDISSSNEEIRALVEWISTFPSIKEVLDLHPIDTDDQPEYLSNWLLTKGVAFGILQISVEIKQNMRKDVDSTNLESNFVNDASIGKVSGFASERNAWNKVTEITNLSDCLEDKHQILSAMLCMAVSEECIKRETYISRIMEIDKPDVQRILMTIIAKEMNKDDAIPHSNSPDSASRKSDVNKLSTSTVSQKSGGFCSAIDLWDSTDNSSPLGKKNLNMNQGLNDNYEDNLSRELSRYSTSCMSYKHEDHGVKRTRNRDEEENELTVSFSPTKKRRESTERGDGNKKGLNHEEIELLRKENELLKDQLKKAKLLEEERADTEAERRLQDLKQENIMINRENCLKEKYESEIKELKNKVEKGKLNEIKFNEAKQQLSELQDEVDVLHHCKQKLSVTEEQLHKLKERLAELMDVEDILKKEEDAHSQAIERCLQLENELNALQPLKRQVENYRGRATEAEFKLAECEDNLQRIKTQNESLVKSNKMLEEMSNYEMAEKEGIKQRLIDESTSVLDQNGGNGLGEGISELNPTLKEELLRLRNENEQLRIYKEHTSSDSIVDLEDKLQDSSRLAGTFKERYLTTKLELEKTMKLLGESKAREAGLRKDKILLNQRIEEVELELSLEREKGITAEKNAKQILQDTITSLTNKAKTEFNEMVENMRKEIAEEKQTSKEKESNLLKTMTSQEKKFEDKISSLKKDFESKLKQKETLAEAKLQETIKKHETDMKKAREEADADRNALMEKGTEMYKKKKEIFSDAITKYKKCLEANKTEFENYREIARAERDEFSEQAKAKIGSLKHKLHVSLGRQRELEEEIGTLQFQKKKLEREKIEIREENERFRRHVGSRLGSDKNSENQLDMLQREYNQILVENRALKERSNHFNVDNSWDMNSSRVEDNKENSMQGTSTNPIKVNDSFLSKMREEHNMKVNKLKDERRELVMRNSAAISDLQKANQRSWELEEELSKTKTELTSTRLSLQRFEHSQRMEDTEHSLPRTFFVNKGREDLASIAVASSTVSILSNSASKSTHKSLSNVRNASPYIARDQTNSNSHRKSTDHDELLAPKHGSLHEKLSTQVMHSRSTSSIPSTGSPSKLFQKSELTMASKKVPSIASKTQLGGVLDGKPECNQS